MATAQEEKIAKLEAKLKEEKAKKRQSEARKRAVEAKKKRSDDTRRKILVGSAILSKVDNGEWPKDRLEKMMSEHLTRADDRALFDLPVLESEQANDSSHTEKSEIY